MIIIKGSLFVNPDNLDGLLALSRVHALRSRTEHGCLTHTVHQDVDNPLRLVFVEEWSDRKALASHLAVPASRAFMRAASMLAVEPPKFNIYEATEIRDMNHKAIPIDTGNRLIKSLRNIISSVFTG
jgi:quinol monooxygenase YgiN